MSCQSLTVGQDPDQLPSFHRSVHFSSDGDRKSPECSLEYQEELDSDACSGAWPSWSQAMSRSAPAACGPGSGSEDSGEARFPRLEQCAHFHYGRVKLGGLHVRAAPPIRAHTEDDGGWVTVSVRPHCDDGDMQEGLADSHGPADLEQCGEWLVTRNADNFKMLDAMLHRCIYDRKVSGLPDLSTGVDEARRRGAEAYESLVSDYLHHFSIIADDSINCGPILNWLQMDNKGHRLLVASEDSNSINVPALAAAYSVRRYVSQARDEISFEVGDMISVIDMPGPSESTWWRGKRGFRVGFFPQQCVAVIGDKVPRNMKQPPPIVGSVAVAPIKPVLRKHGKLISLFRSFILSRPSRRALRQQGILRERVFGCDLGEHLLNSGHDVPLVLTTCASIIEQHGCVDGIYRLSGASSTTQRLRIAFDEERPPPPPQDVHAVASLLKMYFRELPNPLCTYQLYSCFVAAVQGTEPSEEGPDAEPRRLDDAEKLLRMRETVVKLPPPHYRTLAFLMRHLHGMSLLAANTGMTARNMAIVWAPNLLRSPLQQHALQGVAVQAVVTEFLICYAALIFSDEQPLQEECDQVDGALARRPKSLPLATPTKLLSLEEARSKQQLRPSGSREPHYIEVGGGPGSLPRYHTVIQLPPGAAKRGLKRSPSGWRGLFFRASKHRPLPTPALTVSRPQPKVEQPANESSTDADATGMVVEVEEDRAARSCESMGSEGDSLPALVSQPEPQSGQQHNRSVSCDSYFEASLAELAGMRLRLSSQEREMDIFSEDDTTRQIWPRDGGSSADTSAEPSPTKPRPLVPPSPADTRKRTKLEEQIPDLLFIDCNTPEHAALAKTVSPATQASPTTEADAKRVCKEQSQSSNATSPQQGVSVKVKMRERGSPRKPSKSDSRHSHAGAATARAPVPAPHRHSTLIRVDWPGTPASPASPAYVPLHSDSDASLLILQSRDSLAERLIQSQESLQSRDIQCTNREKIISDTDIERFFDKNVGNMVSDDSSEVLSGIIVEDDSKDNLDGQDSISPEKKHRPEFTDLSNDFHRDIAADVDIEHHYDKVEEKFFIESKPVLKLSVNKEDIDVENRCSVTVTPSDENFSTVMIDSMEESLSPANISYQNLNRLSTLSGDSGKAGASKESTPTYSPREQERTEEIYECFSFARPSYIHLASSSGGSTPTTPPHSKSPLKSTISIIYKSPTKENNQIPKESSQNEEILKISVTSEGIVQEDSVYEDVGEIGEGATVPRTSDASLPTQQASQPNSLPGNPSAAETPTEENHLRNDFQLNQPCANPEVDIYNRVKFFRQSVNEVNTLLLDSDEGPRDSLVFDDSLDGISEDAQGQCHSLSGHAPVTYENVHFIPKNTQSQNAYENISMSKQDSVNVSPKISPLSELCLDRRLNHNTYENYTAPYSQPPEPLADYRETNSRNYPDLSLGDFNKENTDANSDEKSRLKRSSTNVRQLAHKFESPTENKGPFLFERNSKANLSSNEGKLSSFERLKDVAGNNAFDRSKAASLCEGRNKISINGRVVPCIRVRNNRLAKHSVNTRSLDENAFVKEFGRQALHKEHTSEREIGDQMFSAANRRKSLEASSPKYLNQPKKLPDLNLNTNCESVCIIRPDLSLNLEEAREEREDRLSAHFNNRFVSITPTTENKISLVQARLSPKKTQKQRQVGDSPDSQKDLSEPISLGENLFDKKDKLSRERIEKYKEERRLFLREKFSPHSFRGIGDIQYSCKSKGSKSEDIDEVGLDGVQLRHPNKLERRNTADAVQRTKFSIIRNVKTDIKTLDDIKTPEEDKSIIDESKEVSPKVTVMQRKLSLDMNVSHPPQRIGASWDGAKSGKTASVKVAGIIGTPIANQGRPKTIGNFGFSSLVTSADKGSPEGTKEIASGAVNKKEKRSPSFIIRDMAAKFEQKSNQPN